MEGTTMKGKENAIVGQMVKELGLDLAKVRRRGYKGAPKGR